MPAYPVDLQPDPNGTLLVTFPDFPEGTTFGEDQGDALLRAVGALETVLAARIDDRQKNSRRRQQRPPLRGAAGTHGR